MEYEGVVYRPPMEANDVLLQVSIGCTHNCCTFCNMFRDKRFRVLPEEQVARNLRAAAREYWRPDRVFLTDGDAFALPANRLARIAELVHEFLPSVTTITTYASVTNIARKTDEDLARLHSLGYDDLYVGIESGLDDVLAHVRKGHTVAQAREQLRRLNAAGISHAMMLMPGLAGSGRGEEAGRAAARLANATKPFLVIPTTVGIFEGTELYDQVQRGEFVEAGERENLAEQRAFLQEADLPGSFYWSAHALNSVPFAGQLNEEGRERMIARINDALEHADDAALGRAVRRASL